MNELTEHKSDPKGMSFVSLTRFRDLTQLGQFASTLMDHNRIRDMAMEHESASRLLTWTIIERNKIVEEMLRQIFSHGSHIK